MTELAHHVPWDTPKISVKELLPPHFYGLFWDIHDHKYRHYKMPGGRGTGKSTVAALLIPYFMMKEPETHGICMRRVANTLRRSCWNKVIWALNQMKVRRLWKLNSSTMEMTYLPTGQKIYFCGADDPEKIKSITPEFGYFGYVWFEERSEFDGEDEEKIILQSLLRGGKNYTVLYTWNPPRTINAWVNQDILGEPGPKTKVYHTTYLTMPREWLGDAFYEEAEARKQQNVIKYRHEYLGEATGFGGQIFDNVHLRKISDEQIAQFDRIVQGLDFGLINDPLAFVRMHYDKRNGGTLYIFREVYAVGMGNRAAAAALKKANPENYMVMADAGDARAIDDINAEYGTRLVPCKKGGGSVEFGLNFMINDIERIIIDPVRCPNTAREFTSYEFDLDKNGNFKCQYPDRDNHSIDAARYGLEAYILRRKAKIRDKKRAGFY